MALKLLNPLKFHANLARQCGTSEEWLCELGDGEVLVIRISKYDYKFYQAEIWRIFVAIDDSHKDQYWRDDDVIWFFEMGQDRERLWRSGMSDKPFELLYEARVQAERYNPDPRYGPVETIPASAPA